MRETIVRIGATGAGALLALGLFAGPSAGAPRSEKQSKNEQSNKVTCFHPEGKTQGRSLSDPDGMDNGGADKPSPDCTGGVDLTDRDGNNGCGNDADREDDNNGNCGGQQDQVPSDEPAQPEGGNNVTVNADTVDADVQAQAAGSESGSGVLAAEASSTTTTAAPTTVSAADDTTPAAETTTPDTEVLGETLSAPDTLARTGAGIGGLALLGGLLVGGGRLTVLARKLLRIG
ncbi:MAG: hypothetical protein ACRDYF_00160 [Acidimicrobiia bacterium]